MISRDMYHVLKLVPRAGATSTERDLDMFKVVPTVLLRTLLDDAVEFGYLHRSGHNPLDIATNRFRLSEAGQVAIEEYEHEEQRRQEASESLKIEKEALDVSKSDKRVAIISIIASVATSVLLYFADRIFQWAINYF